MNKGILKKKITAVALATILTISTGTVIFQGDIARAVSSPKEVNNTMKITNGVNPFSKSIKYMKSTLSGRDIDVYTIVQGEYAPVSLDYFLSLYKDDNGNYLTWKQISEPSKTIYAGIDTDDNKVININLISGSMEPIVFESNKGNKIFIRFSNKFILDNGGKLSDAHELFESEYDISTDPEGIPKELESIAYFKSEPNSKDVKLVVESTIKNIESKPIKEIEKTIEQGGIVGNNSDIFNVESDGNFVGESSHGGVVGNDVTGIAPGYVENKVGKDDGTPSYYNEQSESLKSREDKINEEIDKEIDNPGGVGITLEEALLKQRQNANNNSGLNQRPAENTGNNNNFDNSTTNTGNNINNNNNKDDKITDTNFDSVNLSDIDKITEETIKAKFGKDSYVIKNIEDLHKYQAEDRKNYGDHIIGSFLKTLELDELEKVYEDSLTYKWDISPLVGKLYQEKYSKKLEKELNPYTETYDYTKYTGNGYKDYDYTAMKENADKYKDLELFHKPNYDDVVDFKAKNNLDANGNPRKTWRFKWGKPEESNLKGFTNQNDLLLKGVYDYWEVNLMNPDMQKLDINKFRQIPSEQLLQLPIEFEPMQKPSSVLFKLALFGLAASINMLAVFVVSRKINQTKNMEKFSKNIVFKEEKLNLTTFEDDRFKLDI